MSRGYAFIHLAARRAVVSGATMMEKIWKYSYSPPEHKQHLPEIETSTQMKFTIPFEKTSSLRAAKHLLRAEYE